MKKRILSLILTAAMLLTLVPVFATSAAAAETVTITYDYEKSGQAHKGTYTQEVVVGEPAILRAPNNQRYSASGNFDTFANWKAADGTTYQWGQIIYPEANLSLTAEHGNMWSGRVSVNVAVAVWDSANTTQIGDIFLAPSYSNKGLAYMLNGTTISTQDYSGFANGAISFRVGTGTSLSATVTMWDYTDLARPGDGTNGAGTPAGYEFSHYVVTQKGFYTGQGAAFTDAKAAASEADLFHIYAGDTLNASSNRLVVTHDGVATTFNTTGGAANNGSFVLLPVYKKASVELSANYNANFGENEVITVNSLDVPECTFVNEGHNFLFWNTAADASGDIYYPGDKLLESGTTLYAIWADASKVTVVYFENNELIEIVTADEVIAATPEERIGFAFIGWETTDAEGNKVTYAAGDAITTNCFVNANWKVLSYTISFDGNGGEYTFQKGYTLKYCAFGYYSSASSYGPNVVGTGVSYFMAPNVWKRPGYIFVGLNNQPDGKGNITWTGTEGSVGKVFIDPESVKSFPMTDFTMYAMWEKDPEAGEPNVFINFQLLMGGSGTMATVEGWDSAVVPECTFTPPANNKFYMWIDSTFTTTYEPGDVVTSSVTLVPMWQALELTVTYKANNGTDESKVITGKSPLTIAECMFEAPAGKVFSHWATTTGSDGRVHQPGSTTLNNLTLHAIWVDAPEAPAEITLKADATLVLGEEYVTGLTVGMTVEAFLAQFANEGLAVLNADGEAVTEGAMATGYSVALVVNGEVVDSYIVVVYGDVDGDGIVNVNDIVAVRDYISGTKLDAANVAAANADRDEENLVNVNDIVAIRDHISGTEINQK